MLWPVPGLPSFLWLKNMASISSWGRVRIRMDPSFRTPRVWAGEMQEDAQQSLHFGANGNRDHKALDGHSPHLREGRGRRGTPRATCGRGPEGFPRSHLPAKQDRNKKEAHPRLGEQRTQSPGGGKKVGTVPWALQGSECKDPGCQLKIPGEALRPDPPPSAHPQKMAAARPSLGRVFPGSSILFLCDMQEKFRHKIAYFPQIVSVAARMLRVAQLLEVPVMLTEQYPQGLGPTVPELGAEGLRPLSKTCFSMVPALRQELDSRPQLQSVLLCGIEAQACILNTTLDLLDRGLQVHVVVDACSSRSQVDRLVALARMRQSGAFLSTSEGLILQLVGDAANPQFKEIQKLIKEPAPDSGLLGLFQGQNPLLH
ncbi:isochorismatase domain-containing protein 2 isoform X2 [Aotus nancymaae]|uniref:isochorismatase domain-containing protein 2 isoform X2 n=2 Tax=Aotus nancymaae TaxID=37293 RepID=UPI0030FE0A66